MTDERFEIDAFLKISSKVPSSRESCSVCEAASKSSDLWTVKVTKTLICVLFDLPKSSTENKK